MNANPTDTINRRYDFVLLFDVQDGNPNGDPDAGNLPRIDPQSLQGLVTDGCLKRKIRNAIAVLGEGKPGNGTVLPDPGRRLREAHSEPSAPARLRRREARQR